MCRRGDSDHPIGDRRWIREQPACAAALAGRTRGPLRESSWRGPPRATVSTTIDRGSVFTAGRAPQPPHPAPRWSVPRDLRGTGHRPCQQRRRDRTSGLAIRSGMERRPPEHTDLQAHLPTRGSACGRGRRSEAPGGVSCAPRIGCAPGGSSRIDTGEDAPVGSCGGRREQRGDGVAARDQPLLKNCENSRQLSGHCCPAQAGVHARAASSSSASRRRLDSANTSSSARRAHPQEQAGVTATGR